MTKQRRTVSLDPENDRFLSGQGVNASDLVNKLVEAHRTAGGDRKAMLELREQQLQSEILDLETRAESKRHELDAVRDQLADMSLDTQQAIEEAARTIPADARQPDNPAVGNWAEKAGLPPERFLTRLEAANHA